MRSCLYAGEVRHRRFRPAPHRFRYRLFMVYLDLDETEEAFRGRWLWSARRPAPAWFRRRDFLGDPSRPLADEVRRTVEERTGRRPEGPIRLLTHLRYFGYSFNPVSFYYCFRGDEVEAIVAEITNTPWKERHRYVVAGLGPHRFGKEFHVSPFLPMEMTYRWRFTTPGATLAVHMENETREGTAFDATLSLERRELTGGACARALLRHPVMTAKVSLGIYYQALRLFLKRAPFHVHPAKR